MISKVTDWLDERTGFKESVRRKKAQALPPADIAKYYREARKNQI
jgi:hypothetical protein